LAFLMRGRHGGGAVVKVVRPLWRQPQAQKVVGERKSNANRILLRRYKNPPVASAQINLPVTTFSELSQGDPPALVFIGTQPHLDHPHFPVPSDVVV
jgi:hypothetical protein